MSINTSLGSGGGLNPQIDVVPIVPGTDITGDGIAQVGFTSNDTITPSIQQQEGGTINSATPKLKQPQVNDLIASIMAQLYLAGLNNQTINANKSSGTPKEEMALKLALNKVESQILDQLVMSVQKVIDDIKDHMLKGWLKNIEEIGKRKAEDLKAELSKEAPPAVQILVDHGAVAFHNWLQTLPPHKRIEALNSISNAHVNLNEQYDKLNKSTLVLDALNNGLSSVQTGASADVKSMMGTVILGLLMAGGVHSLLPGEPAHNPNIPTLATISSVQGSLEAMNAASPIPINIPPETANILNLMATPMFYKASLENLSASVGKNENYNLKSAQTYAQSISSLVSNKQFETILASLIVLPSSQGMLNRAYESTLSAEANVDKMNPNQFLNPNAIINPLSTNLPNANLPPDVPETNSQNLPNSNRANTNLPNTNLPNTNLHNLQNINLPNVNTAEHGKITSDTSRNAINESNRILTQTPQVSVDASFPISVNPATMQEAMDRIKLSVISSAIAVLYHAKFGGVTGIEFKELFDDPNTILDHRFAASPDYSSPSIQVDLKNLLVLGSSYLPDPKKATTEQERIELTNQRETILTSLKEYYNDYHNMDELFDVNRVFQQIWNPLPLLPTTSAA